jgi:prepilin-type N-terminal cleavage/methylation domain-containing protein
MSRGFTLVELMICVAIVGTVGGSVGAFYLHHRALARSVVVDRELEHTGRLVLDQLRRDARVSGKLSTGSDSVSFEHPGGRVDYRLERGALIRAAGDSRMTFPRVTGLSARPEGRLLRLHLVLGADLAVVKRRRELRASLLLEARP